MGETKARKKALGLQKNSQKVDCNFEWAQDDSCANLYIWYSLSRFVGYGLYHGDDLFTESLPRNPQGWGVHLLTTIILPLLGFDWC